MADPAAPEPIVRAAQPGDALCLSVLAMHVFLDTCATQGVRPALAREARACYFGDALRQAPANTRTRFCLAELSGHLIGFAQLALGARHGLLGDAPASELLRLYVQRPFRGQQVASRLMAHVEQQAAQQPGQPAEPAGSQMIWLTVWLHNHPARAFYQRRRYVDVGPTVFEFEGESYENRLLAKALPMRREPRDM